MLWSEVDIVELEIMSIFLASIFLLFKKKKL